MLDPKPERSLNNQNYCKSKMFLWKKSPSTQHASVGIVMLPKSGLSKRGWNIRKYVFTKETKWKNSEKRIRNSGPHLKSSVTGKILADSPTWSNVTPRIFNESKKIWKYIFWHPPSEFHDDHDPKRASGDWTKSVSLEKPDHPHLCWWWRPSGFDIAEGRNERERLRAPTPRFAAFSF